MYSQSGHRISKTEILISGFLWFLIPFSVFAGVDFFALLPNPLGTDELGEYIEIRNTGCASVDIGGYHLYDAANKNYILPAGTLIGSHSNLTLPYSQTKITLNNTGNESITLTNMNGVIIDTESYSGTQRDNIVIYLTTTDADCSVTIPVESGTGTSSTGSQNNTSTGETSTGMIIEQNPPNPISQEGTGTVITGSTNTASVISDSGITNSGIIVTETTNTATSSTGSQDNSSTGGTIVGAIDTGTGDQTPLNPPFSGGLDATDTGATNTGTITEPNLPNPIFQGGTGESNTGTTNTGTIESGSSLPMDGGIVHTGTTNTGIIQNSSTPTIEHSNTGILFPEIVPTRQEPTNAIFTGGVWDCGSHQPCRINVTFDPIFTGGLLAKNYICEVITATGTLTTCNPTTLYFSTDSYFSFRLTSKVDPSQSRTMSWRVRFTVPQNNIAISTDIDNLIGEINTGIVDMYSGTTSTGAIKDSNILLLQQSNTGVTFPEIVPTYQNYTNTTNSGNTITCITSPCRVNFTLDPIFTGSFLAKNYTCEIRYGTGVYDSCNPPQLYPIGTGSVLIMLTHRASGQKETKTLEIIQSISLSIPAIHDTTVTPEQPPPLAIIEPDTIPPVAIIEFDAKVQSYYEQIGDYEFNCYTLTCSINLTADRSYDPGGGKIRWLWYYGHNDIKTTRDPGGRKYGLGDHEIWLRVVDLAGNMSEIRYRIHVLGPRSAEEKIKTKKIKDPSLRATKQSSATKTKKKKPKKMDFFDPPTISLQKSKFTITDDGYLCRTKTKTCSLNLTLSGAEKGIIYTWEYDDGEVVISKNPRSRSFAPGSHEITVSASYSGSTVPIWTQILSVQVDKIQKIKKPKKTKVKKSPKPKSSTKNNAIHSQDVIIETEKIPEDDIPYTTMALFGGIIPVLLLRRFLTGMI